MKARKESLAISVNLRMMKRITGNLVEQMLLHEKEQETGTVVKFLAMMIACRESIRKIFLVLSGVSIQGRI